MPTQNQPEIPEARETVVLMRPGVCDAIDDKKSGKCTGSRICLYSVVASVIVNVGLLSLVYILFKNGIVGCAELQTVGPSDLDHLPQTAAALQASTPRPEVAKQVIGRFKINRTALNDSRHIRWVVEEELPSFGIAASVDSPCVLIEHPGLYFVFSQMTFGKTKESPAASVSHFLTIIYKNDTVSLIQKRIISLPIDQNRRQPSNLNAFPTVDKGDRICVNTTLASAVYNSVLDNKLTLFRQFS